MLMGWRCLREYSYASEAKRERHHESGAAYGGTMCQMLFHEESMELLRNVYADHRARVFQLC